MNLVQDQNLFSLHSILAKIGVQSKQERIIISLVLISLPKLGTSERQEKNEIIKNDDPFAIE